jgi:kinesin family protein 3/17
MKLKIEVEKKALVEKKDMEEEEKNKVAQELEKREGDLVEAE